MFVQSKTDSGGNRIQGLMRRRARRGVSLIEILIVLVILVVGILTIIRLFPSGFFSVESVGNAALADSLGIEAIQAQAQNAVGLPDAILPGSISLGKVNSLPADAAFDPDLAPNLDAADGSVFSAHVIQNETLTVPSARTGGGAPESIYVVNYGPIKVSGAASNTVIVNGAGWTAVSGSIDAYPNPKDLLSLGQPNFLVDYAKGQIALPYAFYPQDCVLTIQDGTGAIHTLYLTIPAADSQPLDSKLDAYNPSTATHYDGRWFDPEDATLAYTKLQNPTTPTLPLPLPWKAVMLYRPFHSPTGTVVTATNPFGFSTDPYEFTLVNSNNMDFNLGAIAFNPLGAGRVGVKPLKAQITYQTYGWRVLHEDRDIPAQNGAGNTTLVRLTLKNLRRAGDARPDNTIDPGLIPTATTPVSIIVQDLDTGQPISGAIWDEDTNGTSATATSVNVSYALGRLTLESNAFGDNLTGGTPAPHRIRIFYTGDAEWTVAVQKAPRFYTQAADIAGTTDPLITAGECAFDPSTRSLYFPRCDAGKTVTIEGITAYDTNGNAIPEPNVTMAVGNAVDNAFSTGYVTIPLSGLPTTLYPKGPGGASVTFTAVRGLSARAIVAWKERDLWKVHSVDTMLTQSQ